MEKSFDVIIIGAGPAGWSAAVFLARANVKTLVIGDPGQSGLADAVEVMNYPGFPQGVGGPQLLDQMREQATNQGATFLSGEVVHVEKMNDHKHSNILQNVGMFVVKTADTKEFFANNLVLCHGANYIKVNLPGEKELVGKGVHYCALCDGPLYKGKDVAVLGNSNLAAEEAIELAGMGAKVQKIITHAISANISSEYQKLLDAQEIPVEIGKAEKFEKSDVGLDLLAKDSNGAMTRHSADAVFIALGVASSMVFAQKLGLEMSGNFLKADERGRSNVAGVWVAGLARGGVNQIAKSVGEGATAAVDIIKTIKGLPQYLDHT